MRIGWENIMKKIVKALFRFVFGLIKVIVSFCLIFVLSFAVILGLNYVIGGRSEVFTFVSGLPKQFSFLEPYLIDEKNVLTTKELQNYYTTSLDKEINYAGTKVEFSGIYISEYNIVSLLVYPGYIEEDFDGADWKSEALSLHSFGVELDEDVEILPGYIEGEGIVLSSGGTAFGEKDFYIRITKADNKEYSEIMWDNNQIVGEQDFAIQHTKTLDIPLHNGGVMTRIDLTNKGAYFVIEHKSNEEPELDRMVIEQGDRRYVSSGCTWNEQTEIRWIPEIGAEENMMIRFESDYQRGKNRELFSAEVSLE